MFNQEAEKGGQQRNISTVKLAYKELIGTMKISSL